MNAYTPLIDAILRRWWLVVGTSLVSALFLGWLAVGYLPPFAATADILVIPSPEQTSEILFERHKETLLALATHPLVESRVAQALGDPEKEVSGKLLERVTVSLNGNLLRIRSIADTQEEAVNLVTVWSKEFIAFVNESYTGNELLKEQLKQELDNARERYQMAQADVESFLAQGKLTRAEQEVQRIDRFVETASVAEADSIERYLRLKLELGLLLQDAYAFRDEIMNNQAASVKLEDITSFIQLRVSQIDERYNDLLPFSGLRKNNILSTVDSLNQFIATLEEYYQKIQQKMQRMVTSDSSETIQFLYEQLSTAQGESERVLTQYRSLLHQRNIALSRINEVSQRIERLSDVNPTAYFTLRYLGLFPTPVDTIVNRRAVLTQAAIGALLGGSVALFIVFILELLRFRVRKS